MEYLLHGVIRYQNKEENSILTRGIFRDKLGSSDSGNVETVSKWHLWTDENL